MMKRGFSSVGNAITGLIGKAQSLAIYATGGFGLFSFAESAVNAGENVYQLSVRLGVSAGEAAKFNRIMQFTGVDTQTAATAFTRLDRTLVKGGKSADAMQAYLSQYGVSLKAANGNLLPLNQQIDAMAKGYERAKAEGKGEEFVMQTMGNRGMELIKTFENLKTAKEAAAKVKTTGLNINQMHDAYVDMQALKMQASQLQLSLASAFAPLVQELMPMIMPALQKLAQYIKENKETLASLAVNGAKEYIANISKPHKERLFGVFGAKLVEAGAPITAYLRNYSNKKMTSRLNLPYNKEVGLPEALPFSAKSGEVLIGLGYIPKGTKVLSKRLIAGTGTNVPIHTALPKLMNSYGIDDKWQKWVGIIESDVYSFDIHWYFHRKAGYVSFKLKHRKNKI